MPAPEDVRISFSRTLAKRVRSAHAQGEREPVVVLMSQAAVGAFAPYGATCDTSDYEAIAKKAVGRLTANDVTTDIVGYPDEMQFVATFAQQ